MKLLIILLTFPFLVLSQNTTFPACLFGCPYPACTPWPDPTPITTTTIIPPSPTTMPTTPATITKIWSSSMSRCTYVYWLDVSDYWSLSSTTVTTFGPATTGPYPATITETVISSIRISYVEIYTGGSSWTSVDDYTISSTVVVTANQPVATDAAPTGDSGTLESWEEVHNGVTTSYSVPH